MIQRKQTLWLLLATVAAVLTFLYPFSTGIEKVDNTTMERTVEINAAENLFLILLTIASVVISTVAIFLFKNRGQQKLLCIIGLLIGLGICFFYVSLTLKLIKYVPALWALLPFIVVISYFLAYRGIRSDEKLVKSLDKLR